MPELTGEARPAHRAHQGAVEVDGAPIAYDVVGSGPAVVLVHAGVADRRMWDPVVPLLAPRATVVRYDLRGFGGSSDVPGTYRHHTHLLALVDHLGLDPVSVVGCSLGAYVTLTALTVAPRRFHRAVLISPVLDEVEPTPAVRRAWREEAAALDAGDLARAVEVNLATWIDGPHRRPGDVDPELRRWLGELQADVLAHAGAGDETPPAVPPGSRLGAVTVPTTVVTGTLDQRWVLDCADTLAEGLPDVRLHAVDGTAHLPSVEAPARVARVVLDALPEA